MNFCILSANETDCAIRFKLRDYCKDCKLGLNNYIKIFTNDTNIGTPKKNEEYREKRKVITKNKSVRGTGNGKLNQRCNRPSITPT